MTKTQQLLELFEEYIRYTQPKRDANTPLTDTIAERIRELLQP